MTKTCKNDWRPVATTGISLTTTDVSLATTGALLTTTDDHWRPLTTICRVVIQSSGIKENGRAGILSAKIPGITFPPCRP
jgi:hypothetical protein